MVLRLLTGIPLGFLAALIMAYPHAFGIPFQFIALLPITLFTLRELQRLLGLLPQEKGGPQSPFALWGSVAALIFLWLVFDQRWTVLPIWMFVFLFGMLLAQLRRFPTAKPYFEEPMLVFASTCYVALGFGALLQLSQMGQGWIEHGLFRDGSFNPASSVPLMGTWGYDACALFAGRMTGATPMVPLISPRKSWEGFVGGLAGVAAVMVVGTWWIWHRLRWDQPPMAILIGAAVLGLLLGTSSQLGDLVISCIKRQAHVKDSATLIPYQGGMLDKADGLLVVIPMSLLVLYLLQDVIQHAV